MHLIVFDTSSLDRFTIGGRDRFGGGPAVLNPEFNSLITSGPGSGGISPFTGQPISLRSNFNRSIAHIYTKIGNLERIFARIILDIISYENVF